LEAAEVCVFWYEVQPLGPDLIRIREDIDSLPILNPGLSAPGYAPDGVPWVDSVQSRAVGEDGSGRPGEKHESDGRQK